SSLFTATTSPVTSTLSLHDALPIWASEEALALDLMHFADEVRDPTEVVGDISSSAAVSDKELQMATTLIESMSGVWVPEQYEDTYTARVEQLIAEKAAGKQPEVAEAPPQPTE